MDTDRMDDLAKDVDYMRAMVRRPPSQEDPAAHLAWVRLMAKVLLGLDRYAPLFSTAVCAKSRTLDILREYCESGEYENAYESQLPHAVSFLRFFLHMSSAEDWLKDLARCEFWASTLKQTPAPEPITEQSGLHHDELPNDARHDTIREIVDVNERSGKQYILVSHDVLETMQHLLGYMDTTISRVGRLLWYLQVAPVFPLLEPRSGPGIVVFSGVGSDLSLSYVRAE